MAREGQAFSVNRRSFSWATVGMLVAPRLAIGQASKVVRRIGVLDSGGAETPAQIWQRAEPLRALGWVEGQNLHVERRYGDSLPPEQLQPLAEELLQAQVEIIVTWGTPAALAAKSATTTIPIIFSVGDPVIVGLVASFARPGGNLTGISIAGSEAVAKYLSVVKELVPGLQRIGLLWDVGNPYARAIRGQFENICQFLGLLPVFADISLTSDVYDAVAQLAQQRAQALVLPYIDIVAHRAGEIADAAMSRRLPIMTQDLQIVRVTGALMAYNRSEAEFHRMRAYYIDRILRGAKPADLPVQQPTSFELAINLKTARALGITVPQSLLLRADEVIQ